MSGNPSIPVPNGTERLLTKTPAELVEELALWHRLCMEYRLAHSLTASVQMSLDIEPSHSRSSFFGVIRLFGPTIFAAVVNRHNQRDIQLAAEADKAIVAHMNDRGPGASEVSVRLSTLLELQTILCTEYRYAWSIDATNTRTLSSHRNSYFAIISLIGVGVFNFVGDHHRQHDGVIEAEAARVDDMVERIRHAAD